MSLLRIKNADGTWFHIPAINGKPGKDGAIQYVAGDGIKIDGTSNEIISLKVEAPDLVTSKSVTFIKLVKPS